MTYLRKRPRQERSQATFDAIVEASARILAEDGVRALTTNRIAERAGVSVGSLYQYFPDRGAIVRALLERQLAQASAMRPALIDDETEPRARRVRALVDWYFDLHAANARIGSALARLATQVLPPEEAVRFAQDKSRRAARTLASLGLPRDADGEVATFVLETCLDALCDRALRERPESLRSEALRAEVAALLDGWLGRSG